MAEAENLSEYENLFKRDVKDKLTEDLPEEFLLLNENISTALECQKHDFKRLVSAECSEIQRDEMLALMSIFEEDLSLIDEDCKCFKIAITEKSQAVDNNEVVDLWFSIPMNYPNDLPIFELEGHGGLSVERADELYDLLLEEAYNRRHQTIIYDLVMIAKEFVQKYVVTVKVEKDNDDLVESIDEDEEEKNVFYYPRQAQLRPSQFTGPIHKLLSIIPSHLQIVSIENILRENLVENFKKCEHKMNGKYGDRSRKQPELYVVVPRLGFHGTSLGNMPKIVQTGLKVPGQDGIEVAHGSRYGVGIYLSPDPSYSLSYSGDEQTLLVCSVLLGHCLKLAAQSSRGSPGHNFDSVISSCGKEMVLFNAAQVLPCFIIKLAPRCDKYEEPVVQGGYARTLQKERRRVETPLERKERVQRRAKKLLPFGYGPSSKVEDVADSDDDEEEFGDYQTDRYFEEAFTDYV